MSSITALTRSLLRTRPSALSTLRPSRLAPSTLQHQQLRFAGSDYGGNAGQPAGETPEQQGKNPSEHLEHPGPPAPDVGQGKSGPDASGKKAEGGGEGGVTPDEVGVGAGATKSGK